MLKDLIYLLVGKVGFRKKVAISLRHGLQVARQQAKSRPWAFWIATIIWSLGIGTIFYSMIGSFLNPNAVLIHFLANFVLVAIADFIYSFKLSSPLISALSWSIFMTIMCGSLLIECLLIPIIMPSIFSIIGTLGLSFMIPLFWFASVNWRLNTLYIDSVKNPLVAQSLITPSK